MLAHHRGGPEAGLCRHLLDGQVRRFEQSLCATHARAHAPLPRAVVVSPTGGAAAVALPGFGLLMRTASDPSFAYACDALLGIPPSDRAPQLSYFDDDTLLLGSPAGLRRLDANGCGFDERAPLLGEAPVSALAIHPLTQVAYAIATGFGTGRGGPSAAFCAGSGLDGGCGQLR